MVWGGLEVVWGVLGWFGVFPRTAVLGIRLCEPLYGNTDNLNVCAENTKLSLETCLF